MKHVLFVLLVCANLIGFAQTGIVRGTVYDDASGETLLGVAVVVKGTTQGVITDLDGQFSLELDPGTYNLELSYISYQTLTLEGVKVTADGVNLVPDVRMSESNLELNEVTIVATAVRNTETALQTMKRKSATMMDGISSAKMKLIGDGTAVEAAKRVTGVSIEGGKYVYVRGLGDRYSKTTLNGVEIPGLDPDKNTLQMDIFPTSLISNITVSKNFMAEMPADFTGGLLNIETKDFPENKILDVSVGISYNPNMHFTDKYLSYEGGSLDFLGFDDGARELPTMAKGDLPSSLSSKMDELVGSFDPTLAAQEQTSLLDYSASLSMGNQYNLASGAKLGYVYSLSYKSEYNYYDDVVLGEYQKNSLSSANEMVNANTVNGRMGEKSVLIGAMGGLAYKTTMSKVRLTAMHLQNGESTAGMFDIYNNAEAIGQSGYHAISHNLEYEQRSMTNLLLNGTHNIDGKALEIDWRIAPTWSKAYSPDIRKTAFTVMDNGAYVFNAGAGGNPSRIWRNLEEFNMGSKVDLTYKYELFEKDAKLKFGVSNVYKKRDYEILSYDVQFLNGLTDWGVADPNLVFDPEYVDRAKVYFSSGNSDPNANAYSSWAMNTGAYISNEFEPVAKLKTTLGVRVENFTQNHTGRDQAYANGNTVTGKNLDNENVLQSFDFFPTVNFVYELTDMQNLRFSYGRTIARPSFKELSFAQILDPISNRFFNGGLYQYADWAGNLTSTYINNFDTRWELFLKDGQTFSVSGFYKKFKDPIELVRIYTQLSTSEYQPRNVGDGSLFGVEIEFSKNLGFMAKALEAFTFNGNLTLVKSRISMTESEYVSRQNDLRDGESLDKYRDMAGQSPYVVNAGVTYGNTGLGLDAGLFYNMKGPTLAVVGGSVFPDVYTQPFHSLNCSVKKKFGVERRLIVDLKVSNILNDKEEIFYQSYSAKNQIYEAKSLGTTVSIGASYKF